LKIELRAKRLKLVRQSCGLTQRRLARDVGISQNYVPAIEANTCRADPRLQQ
jgi:DNA-binding XRE family transcriptional regulator